MDIAVYIALMIVLIIASVIDVRTRLVPLWIILACVGVWVWGQVTGVLSVDVPNGILAALLMGGVLMAITCLVEHLNGKFVLGGGDIKLLACIALFLGLHNVLWCLLGACVLALVWSGVSRQHEFPFVPSIAASTAAVLVLNAWV